MSPHHAFGFEGVYLSRNRRPLPLLCFRSGYAGVLCAFGLGAFPVFGKCSSRSDGDARFRPRPSSGLFGMGVVSARDVVSHCSYLLMERF